MWSLLTFVIDKISPSTTFTVRKTKEEKNGCENGSIKRKCLSGEMKIYREASLTIFATNWHLVSILPSPHYVWLGETLSFACQRHICAFSHNHIIASHRFDDYGGNCGKSERCITPTDSDTTSSDKLTYNLEVTFSGSHGIRVHLTHVPASIWLLNLSDVKIPAAVIVVRQHDAWILCDDVVVDAENRLCVDANPRDLQAREGKSNFTSVELHSNRIMS